MEDLQAPDPLEVVTVDPPPPTEARPCWLCPHQALNLKKLKTHLLLKHGQDHHLCLFCVDKKGWSDSFASAAQYNAHYELRHRGKIADPHAWQAQDRERKRRLKARFHEQVRQAQAQGRPIPKRQRLGRDYCLLCPEKPAFPTDLAFHQHLIAAHDYDYCKICDLIGPRHTVRYHIADRHSAQLCHVCGSSSPRFNLFTDVQAHWRRSHGFESRHLICFDCPLAPQPVFPNLERLRQHLFDIHLTRGDVLRPMRKRRGLAPIDPIETADPSAPPPQMQRIRGLPNASGQDCFAISVLHLLAQTDLGTCLDPPAHHREHCSAASCILGHFLLEYRQGKAGLTADRVFQNYAEFDVRELPVDCGDFLRGALFQCASSPPEHRGFLDIDPTFKMFLQWKFECQQCQRFVVSSCKDYVLKIDGSKTSSLADHLNRFLHEKVCRCGAVCHVYPGVKQAGDYIFVEIDRAFDTDGGDSKEIALYSLQLEETYSIFGFQYRVIGTVHYDLEHSEGGHFVTRIFTADPLECVTVHEDTFQTERKKPDFDADAVIVALKKMEISSSTNNLNRIELEIEYENQLIEPDLPQGGDRRDDVEYPEPSSSTSASVMSNKEPKDQPIESTSSETSTLTTLKGNGKVTSVIDLPSSVSMKAKNQTILDVLAESEF